MATNPRLCKALEYLVHRWGPVEGRTRLMKLIYLADLEWAGQNGGPYTEAKYYRWNHGPFSREVLRALEWMDGIEVVETVVSWDGGGTYCYRTGNRTRLSDIHLDPGFVAMLDKVGERWKTRSLKELLEFVYAVEQFQGKHFGQPLM
jgi:hypothetical protein